MIGVEEGNTVSKDNLNHPKNLNDSKDNINRPKDSLNHPKDHLNHLRDKRNNPKDHLNHPKDHLNHPKDSLNAQKQSRHPLESSTNGDESKGSLSIVSSGKDTRDDLVLEYLIPDDAANSDRFIRDIKQYRQSLTEYPVIKLK
uniref:Uncharacterized protein n=1 Tax=Cacopsylla melanoneura TaxID=428564 RepID=A0A8D8Q1B8_9HEMI